jgi:hypothetical protein
MSAVRRFGSSSYVEQTGNEDGLHFYATKYAPSVLYTMAGAMTYIGDFRLPQLIVQGYRGRRARWRLCRLDAPESV